MMLRRLAVQRKNMDLVNLDEEEEFFKNPTEFQTNQSEHDNHNTNQSELGTQNCNQSQDATEGNHDNDLGSNPIKTAAWGEGDTDENTVNSHELNKIYRKNNTDIFDEEFYEQSGELEENQPKEP